MTAEERAGRGHRRRCPQSLAEALDVMERSELVAEALGEHVFEWFLRNKRAEWVDYKAQVTQFELDRYLPSALSRATRMEPLLVFPDPAPPRARPDARPGGLPVEGRRPTRRRPRRTSPTTAGPARSSAPTTTRRARSPSAGRCASATLPLEPLLLLVSGAQLGDLELRDDLFDDFCLAPFHPRSSRPGCKHLFWRTGRGTRPELVEYGDLVLNLETYQAAIAGQPLDLTYMEYELLKFLASHPGKVFTRETLLSRVWGYEYYGGARTVDVHVRRLRAKLGEEHANLIQTVRSVGYRFGQSRWGV